MKKFLLLASLSFLSLSACAGAAKVGGGKQGAANSLAAASRPTRAGTNVAATPIDVMPVDYSCPHGGSATLGAFTQSIEPTATGGVVSQKFTVTYVNCGLAESAAGVAIYNGSFSVSQRVSGSNTGGSVSQQFSGRVTIGGAFDDFLEADVSQEVSGSSALESATGSVKLVGKLTNSSGTYSYDESVNVAGSKLEVSSSSSQQ